MTLLFCGPAFPFFHPLILIPAFAITIASAVLVYKGLFGFAMSEEKPKLLLSAGILSFVLMIPYLVFDIPVLSTLPFGLGAGLAPLIFLEVFVDHGPLLHQLEMAAGCLLNAIAILYLTDRISKRIRGEQDLETVRLP